MKKTTLLNAPLSQVIATLGHTDSLTVGDAGLPIPACTQRIDLALTCGVPDFLTTVDSIISEMFVERAVLAEEIKQKNPQIHTALLARLQQLENQQGNHIELDYVPHQTFKQLTHNSKAIVRSGECSPYANVILYSGVPF